MGAALYPTLGPGEGCATIEIKINFFKPVIGGAIVCAAEIVSKGRTIANLEACVYVGEVLVAKANGTFAIFRRKMRPQPNPSIERTFQSLLRGLWSAAHVER